jgi:hypothetical protein
MYTIRIVIFEFYKTKCTFTKLKSWKIKHGLRQSIERTQDTYYKNRSRFRTFLPHRYNPGRLSFPPSWTGTWMEFNPKIVLSIPLICMYIWLEEGGHTLYVWNPLKSIFIFGYVGLFQEDFPPCWTGTWMEFNPKIVLPITLIYMYYVSMIRRGWAYFVCLEPFEINFDIWICGPIPGILSTLLNGHVNGIQPHNSVGNHINIYVSMIRRGWAYFVCLEPFKVNLDLGLFTFKDRCDRLRHILFVVLCAELHHWWQSLAQFLIYHHQDYWCWKHLHHNFRLLSVVSSSIKKYVSYK